MFNCGKNRRGYYAKWVFSLRRRFYCFGDKFNIFNILTDLPAAGEGQMNRRWPLHEEKRNNVVNVNWPLAVESNRLRSVSCVLLRRGMENYQETTRSQQMNEWTTIFDQVSCMLPIAAAEWWLKLNVCRVCGLQEEEVQRKNTKTQEWWWYLIIIIQEGEIQEMHSKC